LSKRQDRPASILWLVKFHPELSDGQISKLVGTTKPTIQSIRERTHWNISNIQPIDPVALGLCKQSELDAAVQKANAKKARDGEVMSDDERRKLVSTEQSLGMDPSPRCLRRSRGWRPSRSPIATIRTTTIGAGRRWMPTACSTCPTRTRMTTTRTTAEAVPAWPDGFGTLAFSKGSTEPPWEKSCDAD
jgi:hypothetical protein